MPSVCKMGFEYLFLQIYTYTRLYPPTSGDQLRFMIYTSPYLISWFILLQAGHLCFPNQGDFNSSGDLEVSWADLNKWRGDGKSTYSRWVAASAITVFTCRLFSCFYQFFSFSYLLGKKLAPVSAAPLMPVPSLVPVLSVQPSGDTQRTASGSWGGCKVMLRAAPIAAQFQLGWLQLPGDLICTFSSQVLAYQSPSSAFYG